MLSCPVLTHTPPQGMVPPGLGPGTKFPALGCARLLPIHLPFISSLSLTSCKYHRIQHVPRLQPLSTYQSSITPTHGHHRSTGGGGVHTITMAGGGGGVCDAGAYMCINQLTCIYMFIIMHISMHEYTIENYDDLGNHLLPKLWTIQKLLPTHRATDIRRSTWRCHHP